MPRIPNYQSRRLRTSKSNSEVVLTFYLPTYFHYFHNRFHCFEEN